MSDFSEISDISEEKYLSDEDFELNDEIQRLKQNLTETYITKFFKKKYKLKMNDNKSKKNTSISNEEYFKTHEQIDEVKYNLFMIMHNGCKIDEEYSTFINFQNEFKLRRLTIQECTINNNIIIPGQKQYSFIPKNSNKGKGVISNYEFFFGKDIISIKLKDDIIDELKINEAPQAIINEDTLISNYKISLPKTEKELKEKSTLPKSDKGNRKNKPENLNDVKTTYSSPGKNNENLSYRSDDSLKEFIGKTVYVKKENNKFVRYIYLDSYDKEIDGVYTKHNGINLNEDNIIDINDLINKEIKFNDNNDLKAHIIFKNFQGNKIAPNTPFILEIKKNFKLYELMQQIKQNCKILGKLKLNTDNISIPKYIIGVLCKYSDIGIRKEMESLNKKKYNSNIEEINHIKKIIENNNINVIVCMLKDEKICNYNIGLEDYKIKEEDIKYRVDIKYMYSKIYNKDIDEKLFSQIIEENKKKFISITAEKIFTYDDYKKLKDAKDEEIAKIQNDIEQMKIFIKEYGLLDEYEKRKKDKNA